MAFCLQDIKEGSRANIVFVFSNERGHEARVHTRNVNLFDSHNYVFGVTHSATFTDHKILSSPFTFAKLGVVLKKTSTTSQIASGSDRWVFPVYMCEFRPGTDVWVHICKL